MYSIATKWVNITSFHRMKKNLTSQAPHSQHRLSVLCCQLRQSHSPVCATHLEETEPWAGGSLPPTQTEHSAGAHATPSTDRTVTWHINYPQLRSELLVWPAVPNRRSQDHTASSLPEGLRAPSWLRDWSHTVNCMSEGSELSQRVTHQRNCGFTHHQYWEMGNWGTSTMGEGGTTHCRDTQGR